MAPTEIPIIDLTPFTTHDDEARKRTARAFATKFSINGCVGISGHGLSCETFENAFALAKQLFDLPYETKMKAPHPNATAPHRGYSGTGRESGAAKTALETNDADEKKVYQMTSDWKETYEVGSEDNEVQYNIWLPDDALPEFRPAAIELFWKLNEIADAILNALIMSLDLSEDEEKHVRALHTGHENQLRLAHYPPAPRDGVKNGHLTRLAAHKDWSSFTLLFQDELGGLEFQDRATGMFVLAKPAQGVLYVNIGDMFERISNGFYPSALHRVVFSSPDEGGITPGRYSIPYFVMPSVDATIEPQPSRVAKDGKANFEPISFNKYSAMLFEATRNHT